MKRLFHKFLPKWKSGRLADKTRLALVEDVCKYSGCGIFKRIDENRKLLEVLHKESPDLFKRCPRIEAWIKEQDLFLNDLVIALEIKIPFAEVRAVYPRPWPGKNLNRVKENF